MRLGQQRGGALHRPVQGDVIDLHAIRQEPLVGPLPQVVAHESAVRTCICSVIGLAVAIAYAGGCGATTSWGRWQWQTQRRTVRS